MSQIEAYARQNIFLICQALNHDPSRVSRIIIEPMNITVEYVHPVIDYKPDEPEQ